MENIFDYIKWRGDLPFSSVPFCEVDNLIFSLLSYLDYDNIVSRFPSKQEMPLYEVYEKFFADGRNIRPGLILTPELNGLLEKAGKSKRFSHVMVSNYINQVDKIASMQFSATLFRLPDKSLFVSYRGTDDTITGWRENFALSFEWAVPAQIAAAGYLNSVSKLFSGKIRTGGHSKGGNLAVFAAAECRKTVFWRITDVFNNDGPGFGKRFFESMAYRRTEHKIHTFIPESSVIGLLLEHDEDYITVKSSRRGILQHDAFSWEVLGGSFVRAEDTSQYSKRTDKILRSWLNSMDPQQLRSFTEAFFNVLEASNAETLSEIQASFPKKLLAMAKAFRETDKETKEMLMRLLKQIFQS